MKCALLILFWLLPWITRADETQNPPPEGGGVLVEPSNGEIEAGTVLTFTFPTSMIETANIDVPNQPLPFTSQPALEGEFLWKSQTEGTFTIKRVKAGTTYHLALAQGANDLAWLVQEVNCSRVRHTIRAHFRDPERRNGRGGLDGPDGLGCHHPLHVFRDPFRVPRHVPGPKRNCQSASGFLPRKQSSTYSTAYSHSPV